MHYRIILKITKEDVNGQRDILDNLKLLLLTSHNEIIGI